MVLPIEVEISFKMWCEANDKMVDAHLAYLDEKDKIEKQILYLEYIKTCREEEKARRKFTYFVEKLLC